MTEQPKYVGGGRASIGDIAPKLGALTDDVLFGYVWNRAGLAELVEAIAHLAFYTGWPKAMTAAGVAREMFSPAK